MDISLHWASVNSPSEIHPSPWPSPSLAQVLPSLLSQGGAARSASARGSKPPSLKLAFTPFRAMLRVIVESAINIPKTKFGKPDPIVSVIFKGKTKFSSFSQVLFRNVRVLAAYNPMTQC